MLYDFPYEDAGFNEREWESIPRTDKLIIRDYHMMNGDMDQVMFFGFYETDRKIRGAMKEYHLRSRPLLQLVLANNDIQFRNTARVPTCA